MGLKERFVTVTRSWSATDEDAAEASPPRNELRLRKQHRWDPFLDNERLETSTDDAEGAPAVDEAVQDDSPYPEVRASVPPTDDPDMPVNTIRAWFLGVVLCTVIAACNVLLSLRRQSTSISPTVIQLLAYPMGVGLAKVLPTTVYRVSSHEFTLNPGPFNVKEHTVITMMTAAGSSISYAIEILLAQEVFYDQHFKWGFQLLLMVSTQAMGFGVAGIARRFLVWPSAMVWPANLVTCTVMHALHTHVPADPAATSGWKMGRYSFFLVVALACFAWTWVPQVFAQFLQYFAFACWIAPRNVVVNQIFGAFTGLGIVPVTFDWLTVSSWLGSPLESPAFAILNVAFGLFICLVGAAGLVWAGPDYYRYLPISNFDRYAGVYNTSRILNANFTINEAAYHEYSPILLGANFSLSYGMGFAGLISTIVHVVVFYGGDIWSRVKDPQYDEPDVHLRLMRRYKEAPQWWFAAIFSISFAFGMIASQAWQTHLPWWAYIVCIIIGAALFIPIGMVQAITNQQTGLNVVTEMIFGYMLPGRPVAMMLFKSWGYMLSSNGLDYISNMKIGHYMKVPPRSMFAAQAFAVVWLAVVQTCTYNFLLGNIEGICTEDQAQGLTCPNARTFYNSSVIWGVIGPKRVFGLGGIYSWINLFWLIGAALPVIQYLVARRYPRSFVRFIVWPAVFSASSIVPPATLYFLTPWVIVGLFFNWYIRRRYFGWWTQYTYVLSGALDIGSRICVVIIALALGLGNVPDLEWWGNTVPFDTLDFEGTAVTKAFVKNVTKPLGPSVW
ncbi:OPT oligopeptide transporter [Metarhizium robertsii]|uniref:OPT oligopeptide transporter n=1 Tax=Metarhizium robertsii TaxID=568076 RepID=A0A0A1UW72_9HYPO|nr:OPT oligopeptide transporter [Metarhizium robertsii]